MRILIGIDDRFEIGRTTTEVTRNVQVKCVLKVAYYPDADRWHFEHIM